MAKYYTPSLHHRNRLGGLLSLLIVLCLGTGQSMAQALILQSESFEAPFQPAPGWRLQKGSTGGSIGEFSHITWASATNPAPGTAPSGGTNIVMFNSFTANTNDTAFLITKPFDFSQRAASTPALRFYMFRDAGVSAVSDRIRVYINTVPSVVGATLLTNTAGTDSINRRYNIAPVQVATGWYQYTYNVPVGLNGKRYYFIVMGITGDGATSSNMYFDRFEVDTYPGATLASDAQFDLFLGNGATTATSTNNHWIVGVRCIVGGTSGCGSIINGTAIKLDSLLMNTNGTTNVNDIQNARIWYTGGYPQFSTGYVSPFPVTAGTDDYPSNRFGVDIAVPGTNLDFRNTATCFHLEYDTTYFWLTYDIKATATGGNFLDADLIYASVGGTGGCPSTVPGTQVTPGVFSLTGASQIDLPYCVPTYTVGTSWLNGSYSNNDFVQSVELFGESGTVINTNVGPSNNNTGLPPTAGPGCFPNCDFTAHPPDYELWSPSVTARTVILKKNSTYTMTVQAGTWFSSNYINAFIDYNHDGDFSDAFEKLAPTAVNLLANATGTITFTVPPTATYAYTGNTRLRVREVFANANLDACGSNTFGETEDFTITIIPDCPVGYKLWLGNTDDWNNITNWCNGVPTLADSAVIDKAQVAPAYAYKKPTIKSGIAAIARSLTISNQDTLIINSPSPAVEALHVSRDLVNNGRIEVYGSFTPELTYSTGTLTNFNYTIFRGNATDSRIQIVYTAAELAAQGLIAGDRITAIKANVTAKNSTSPYTNYTIMWDHTAANEITASSTPLAVTQTARAAAPLSTVLGVNTIPLGTPIVWNGTQNIVIQFCHDNVTAPGLGADQMTYTQTTGRKSTLVLTSATNFAAGCALVGPTSANVNDAFFASPSFNPSGQNRPNLTLVIDRPFGRPTITLRGDLTNNGSIEPGKSLVVMDSAAAQTIKGTQNTTFYNLTVNKSPATTVTQNRSISILDSLVLTAGAVVMNKNSINLAYNEVGALTRSAGALISEDSLSKVNWSAGTAANNVDRIFPFGSSTYLTNTTTQYIPVRIRMTNGSDMGTISLATYATGAANTPFPPTVTQINAATTATAPAVPGTNNSACAADRFWILSKTGTPATPPVTTLEFRFTDLEKPTCVSLSAINAPRAQVWNPGNSGWKIMAPVYNNIVYSVPAGGNPHVTGVTNYNWAFGNSNPWAVSTNSQPLPIELLSFTARPSGSRVRLDWTTLSEKNNDYFTVERSGDQQSFDFVSNVDSWFGNSSSPLSYRSWDEKPLPGISYYRLKQTDFNGDFTYSNIVPVEFGVNGTFEITNVYTEGGAGMTQLEFMYNSEAPLDILITDLAGRVVYSRTNVNAGIGLNSFDIHRPLTPGVYMMTLQNSSERVTRKFVY